MAKNEQQAEKVNEVTTNEHFHTMTARELLDYREFADILYAFYDNEMKVYGGEFGISDSIEYKNANREATKYLKIKEEIFNEIKSRVDTIYEKTFV